MAKKEALYKQTALSKQAIHTALYTTACIHTYIQQMM